MPLVSVKPPEILEFLVLTESLSTGFCLVFHSFLFCCCCVLFVFVLNSYGGRSMPVAKDPGVKISSR